MNSLSSKEKAELRGVAQRLKPTIHIGRNGLAEPAVKELLKAFEREELIKVAFKADRDQIPLMCTEVERLTRSQCVGGVGRKRSFYRQVERQADFADEE